MIRAYHQPESLASALALVARGAQPVAGATALYTAKSPPDGELVDVTRLGLGGIEVDGERAVLGATATLAELAAATAIPGVEGELLRRAARAVASPPLRSAITVGGNIAHGAFWSDLPVALLALDADLEVQRAGEPPLRLALADGSKPGARGWAGGLITRVLVPLARNRRGAGWERFSRTASDYSLATACAVLRADGVVLRDVRLVLGAVQPRPFRVAQVEAMLEGQTWSAALLARAQARLVELAPIAPNFRASVGYRRELAGVLARRALAAAWTESSGEVTP